MANAALVRVLARESADGRSGQPSLPDVARFEFFRKTRRSRRRRVARAAGPAMRFALPITTGTRPGVADYLPAPHGLPGFAVPVEQNVPALVPYLELEDGRTIVAADGADEIEPSADGRQLRAVWRRWARIGAKSGELVDPGLTSEVRWTLGDGTLTRTETLTARAPMTIRTWRVVVPTPATAAAASRAGRVLSGSGPALSCVVDAPGRSTPRFARPAAGRSGAAPVAYIPLHLTYEAHDLRLTPGQPIAWQLTLKVETER